jgi:hypothetical protein
MVVVVAVTSRVVVAIAVMVVMAMAIELASGVPLLFSTHVRGRAGRRSLVPGRGLAVQGLVHTLIDTQGIDVAEVGPCARHNPRRRPVIATVLAPSTQSLSMFLSICIYLCCVVFVCLIGND